MAETPAIDTGVEEHLAALKTVRGAEHLFGSLVALSLVVPMVLFAAGRYGGVFDEPVTASPPMTTSAPTTTVAPVVEASGPLAILRANGARVRSTTRVALSASRLVGTAAAALLAAAMMLAIGVSLAGRLGGARSMVIGFFYAMIVLLLLCPWERWLDLEGLPVSGAYYGLAEIEAAIDNAPASTTDRAVESVRFFGISGAALLLVAGVALRFRRGFSYALERVDPQIRARVI